MLSLAAFSTASSSRATEAPAALQHALSTAHVGDIVDITAFSSQVPTMTKLNVSRTWSGGTLVFSDSPEYVRGPGILYADTLPPGPARFFVYHVNDSANSSTSKQDLKVCVIVEPANAGESPSITIKRTIVYGPGTNYGSVGVKSAFDLVGIPQSPTTRTITGPTVLDAALESKVVPGQSTPSLIEAQYNVEVGGASLKFTIAAFGRYDDSLTVYETLQSLPREEKSPGVYAHDRGTFPGNSDKSIVVASGPYSTSSGMAHIRVGGGAADTYGADAWAGQSTPPGLDAMLGITSSVRGNYGVLYRFSLAATSPDARRVAILMNPRGGASGGGINLGPSLTGQGAFYAPAGGSLVSVSTQATLVGRWNPALTPTMNFTWTPPGATSLPVEFILVPYPEPGDVNANGAVDLADAAMAARYATGLASPSAKQLAAADVAPPAAPDGIVTAADVAWILRQAAGLK